MDTNQLLEKQIAYYRARAEEYDEWFYRKGCYDRGEASNHQWFAEGQIVRDALHSLPHQSHILELAPGTGIWTQELIKLGDKVTAIDASPEMININKAKLQSDKVEYIQANLFEWQPQQQYDMVFFGFWLSHVPPHELNSFLKTVASALKPDGLVFMVDSRKNPIGTAKDQPLNEDGYTQDRILNDGSEFVIVKVYYELEPLDAAFKQAGIEATAQYTDQFFIFTQGRKI
jgi:demethylmenaquinone methyltransferase/2-methoxy-6-polyprenyl-1,4-benzoquinol methylase